MKYDPPGFKKGAFTCPHCEVRSLFSWKGSHEQRGQDRYGKPIYFDNGLHIATCINCKGKVVWFEENAKQYMLYPADVPSAPLPHQEMPDDVKVDYAEARSICNASPRGAAALLRLGMQKLCKHLGGTGENLNDDIAILVKNGLPETIQQALDVVRVTGNNAVHPGEIRVEDDPEIATALFRLLNMIIENRIAEPKRVKAMYESLPAKARLAIEKRDGLKPTPPMR